jgi:hypothetical protein
LEEREDPRIDQRFAREAIQEICLVEKILIVDWIDNLSTHIMDRGETGAACSNSHLYAIGWRNRT